jgi:CheY-like chemotaxis protein
MKSLFLVVDADATDRSRMAAGLKQFDPGCEVLEAATGGEALAALESRAASPSLIFMGYRVGDMNAIELLGRIRQVAWLQQPPAILVDDDISDKAIVDCHRLGAAAFLRKPVLGYELREALQDFTRPAFERYPMTIFRVRRLAA